MVPSPTVLKSCLLVRFFSCAASAKALYNAMENDIPLDSIDIKDLSQKSEITVLFLEIRIIGDKHINIYSSPIVLQMEIRRQGQLLSR
jgi:hypothetical protein